MPRDPVDRLTDHRIEPPLRTARLPQQRPDTTIPRHRDLHPLMADTTTAVGNLRTPGLHVIEVGRDDRTLRQGPLTRP